MTRYQLPNPQPWWTPQEPAWDQLERIMHSPNPFLELPIPEPPPLQFGRVPMPPLQPWQVNMLQAICTRIQSDGSRVTFYSTSPPPDPMEPVREALAEWLDEYDPKAPPLPQRHPGALAARDQLVARASDPYVYTPLED